MKEYQILILNLMKISNAIYFDDYHFFIHNFSSFFNREISLEFFIFVTFAIYSIEPNPINSCNIYATTVILIEELFSVTEIKWRLLKYFFI